MLELLLAWLEKQYIAAIKQGDDVYWKTTAALAEREQLAFQRGREMAFYCAASLIRRHRDNRNEEWFVNMFTIHNGSSIYISDGQFEAGYREAMNEIRNWIADYKFR